MADIFDAPEPNAFEQLVGEGKKFATPEDLARAKQESDRTIESRNQELEAHRQEIARQREELELLRRQPPAPKADEPENVQTRRVEEEPQDLATRIREELNRQTQEDIRNQNLTQVTNKLEELYGEKAAEVLRTKATELGVSPQFLRDQAAISPTAFYATLGLNSAPQTAPAATRGDVNVAVVGSHSSAPKEGTMAYHNTVMKTNPKLYWTAEYQNRIHADAKRLGDAFFN